MKVDFKKALPEFYGEKSGEFHLVDVPEMSFLMIDGKGNPNTSKEYQAALETLYPVSYKAKFISKRQMDRDYIVSSLEGLWWADDMSVFTDNPDKSSWQWTMMIMQPEWITKNIIEEAKVQAEKKGALAAMEKLRFERFHEGASLQCLHIGSYADEAPKLAKLHNEIMPELGYGFNGNHHEIYLSDPRRVAPEKLKTILRQPVKKK